MFDTEAAETLSDRQSEAGYVFPAYAEGTFADVPTSALAKLNGEFEDTLPERAFAGVDTGAEHVVVLVLDGLGWDQWARDRREAPFLQTLTEQGRVTPLTSIYPSETAAAITTLHTGVKPIEHGLLGWHAYLREIDESVFTLPFETRDGDPVTDEHPDAGADLLYKADSLSVPAEAAGIDTYGLQPASHVESVYTKSTYGPATLLTYDSLPSFAVSLRHHIESTTGPAYTVAYVPHIDTVAHRVGTEADAYRATVSAIGHVLERELVDRLDPETAAETLLLTTADHGHLDTGPHTRVDLEADLGGVAEYLERDPSGEPIPPQGGPRNVQFHVRDGQVPALRKHLETSMPCLTFDREEYLDRGLFGPGDPSPAFERRAPDLVAVHLDSAVWDDPEGLQHVGVHGGLTRAEMLIPLGVARLDSLVA